jgi:hypothetical protein
MSQLATLLTLLISVSAYAAETGSNQWMIVGVDRVQKTDVAHGQYEDVSIRHQNGRSYHLPMFRAEPIAVLKGADGAQVLLAAGADCVMCDENITLRFFVLGGPDLKLDDNRYSYPGELKDYESGNLVSRTRTLYGRCLSDEHDVVVWFEEYLGEDGKWHKATALGRITTAGVSYLKANDRDVSPALVAKRKKIGVCKEIPGTKMNTEP